MITGRDERVLLKLVVDAQSDRVVGCHIVGPGSSEMAQLLAIPLKMNATKTDFDAAVALHPTISEEIVTMRVPVARHRWDVAGRRSGPISI
jgi:glutathione reductase (NADPH)